MGFKIDLDGSKHSVEIVGRRPHLRVRIEDREYEVSVCGDAEVGRQTIVISGKPFQFTRAHVGDRQIVRLYGRTFETLVLDPRSETAASRDSQDHVRAPMPGSVISVHKRAGDFVARGDTLVTIESMKLQMSLLAPRDGIVLRVPGGTGETFGKDEVVAELEPINERD